MGGCKEWRNGGWVEVPCATSSGGGGTPSNYTRYTRKQQRLDEKQQRLDEAYEANEQGVKYFNKQDYANAIAFFQEALNKDPGDKVYQNNLTSAKEQLQFQQQAQLWNQQQAQLLIQQNKNKDALVKMQQSVQAFTQTLNTVPSTGGLDFDGNNSTTSANKNGNSSSLQFGDPKIVNVQNVLSGLRKETEDAITGAYKNAPPGVSDMVHKGFQAVTTNDWKVAKAWFQQALLLDPNNKDLKKFILLCDFTPGGPQQLNPSTTTQTNTVANTNVPANDKLIMPTNADLVQLFSGDTPTKADIKQWFTFLNLGWTAMTKEEIDWFNSPQVQKRMGKYVVSISPEEYKKLLNANLSNKQMNELMFENLIKAVEQEIPGNEKHQ